jgi:GABA permease
LVSTTPDHGETDFNVNEQRVDDPSGPGLARELSQRQLSMIAIGGVIGAGLFVASGQVIHAGGPAVVLSYALTGVLIMLVMRMLGEMATANPRTGSFSTYAEQSIGRWAGFSVGWLYWWFWVVTIGAEATAGAAIVHRWIPAVPQSLWVLALMIALTVTNLFSVRSYGEFEFWFSAIKVAATETADPVNAVRKAVRTVVWRVSVFYIGSIAVVVALLPYDDASVSKSPFVAVLDRIGLPGAGAALDVIVLTAVLSCLNSGLYTASRMAFSLSERGQAPAAWHRLSGNGVPRVAVISSTIVGFLTVILNYFLPEQVFSFMVNTSGAIAVFVWLAIAFAQLRGRRTAPPERLVLRMWGYPYLTWVAIVGMVALLVGMLFDESGRPQLLASAALAAVVIVVGVVRQRRSVLVPIGE